MIFTELEKYEALQRLKSYKTSCEGLVAEASRMLTAMEETKQILTESTSEIDAIISDIRSAFGGV